MENIDSKDIIYELCLIHGGEHTSQYTESILFRTVTEVQNYLLNLDYGDDSFKRAKSDDHIDHNQKAVDYIVRQLINGRSYCLDECEHITVYKRSFGNQQHIHSDQDVPRSMNIPSLKYKSVYGDFTASVATAKNNIVVLAKIGIAYCEDFRSFIEFENMLANNVALSRIFLDICATSKKSPNALKRLEEVAQDRIKKS